MTWARRGSFLGLIMGTLACVAVWAMLANSAPREAAAQADAGGKPKDDHDVIRPIEHIAKCYNAKDAKGFAANWAAKAEYLDEDSGERFSGRAAIVGAYAEAFAEGPKVRLEIEIGEVRRLGDSAAAIEGTARLVRIKAQPARTKFLALVVKQNGKWLIDNVRESRLASDNPNADMIAPLAWLDGTWKSKQGEREVTMECAPVANGNFRSHRFQVKIKGQVELAGTQIIGWDAVKQQLRSWTFSSDGSFGEGVIEIKGDTYTAHVIGTLPSGEKSSATQIITRKGPAEFTYQSLNRSIGASALPDVSAITLTKTPAGAGKGE